MGKLYQQSIFFFSPTNNFLITIHRFLALHLFLHILHFYIMIFFLVFLPLVFLPLFIFHSNFSFSQSFLSSHQEKPPAIMFSRRPPSLATAFRWKLSFAAMVHDKHFTSHAYYIGLVFLVKWDGYWKHINVTQQKKCNKNKNGTT